MRFRGNVFTADPDKVLGTAYHARGRPTHLNMRDAANGLQLKHEIEGRNLKHPDMGHAQHIADSLDYFAGDPPLLFLRAPKKRYHRACLSSLRVFRNLSLGPCLIFRCESKIIRLIMIQAS